MALLLPSKEPWRTVGFHPPRAESLLRSQPFLSFPVVPFCPDKLSGIETSCYRPLVPPEVLTITLVPGFPYGLIWHRSCSVFSIVHEFMRNAKVNASTNSERQGKGNSQLPGNIHAALRMWN